MGSVLSFRRLRWGPPRRLPTPRFLRKRRSRVAWLRRYVGFFALAAMMGAGAYLLQPWQGVARTVGGQPVTVVDGDSLRAGSENIRLVGIDAPELRQSCRDRQGREWACGHSAKARLAALVSRGEVACVARGRDRYGRTLAICSAGGVADVGQALVRARAMPVTMADIPPPSRRRGRRGAASGTARSNDRRIGAGAIRARIEPG